MNHNSLDVYDNDSKTRQYNDARKYKSSYWKNKERRDAITNEYRRTKCTKCKQWFTQSYTRLVYICNFTNGIVCKDCKKKYNLHQVV